MIYRIQDSLDGKNWRDIGQIGLIRGKQSLRKWVDDFEQANSIDWRVGYLLRCRGGKYFRAVTNKGVEVKP